jgi:hypothetical protein
MSTPSLSHTYFGSALTAGSALTEAANGGYVVLNQFATLTSVSAGTAVDATITIPQNCAILGFVLDTLTAPVAGAGTATTAPIRIGTSAGGQQYVSDTDCFTGGRTGITFTAAQVTAMSSTGTNTSVNVRLDPDGTILTTQGVFRVAVSYIML